MSDTKEQAAEQDTITARGDFAGAVLVIYAENDKAAELADQLKAQAQENGIAMEVRRRIAPFAPGSYGK